MLHLCRSFISVVSSWYDEDKEFEDKLDEVVLENAKVIALTGNNAFSVKKLLSVDDLTTNYLVYSPCVYNRPDDNWLLDVELYSEEFWADLISIWMDEMGLISNPAMRKQVKNYRAYFNAKDRCLKKGYRNPTGFRRWVKVAKSSGLCYTYAMGTWKSKNRHKYLLQYHIIFVCKYRKKLLTSKQISDDIKQFSYEICQRYNVIIRHMETDKDHIHYMIETEPTMSVSKIVNLMKSYTTYHIWERYSTYLRKHFWKEHTFWTDGYFACSVGNVKEVYRKSRIEGQVAANVKSI